MFIPSIYKSAPQVIHINAGNGDYAISSVNPNYTRVTPQGFPAADASGFPISKYLVARIKNATTLEIVAGADNFAPAPAFSGYVLVEEFLPLFFRQIFYRSSITLTDETLSGTENTGLTLSDRAYVLSMGWSGSASILVSSSVQVGFSIDTSTGIVTMNRSYTFAGNTGSITGYFMVIDPK